MKINLVSLGCARNLVDSEIMLGRLEKEGWEITQHSEKADIIIVNTCSFIEPAIDESVDTILELAQLKKTGLCRRLIVVGCLPERFKEKLVDSLPEVDFFLGTGAFHDIVKAVDGTLQPFKNHSRCHLPDPNSLPFNEGNRPRILSNPHTAYLKIAEGCNRFCTYCIIPQLRGKQKSRPLEDIVAEAALLKASGVKELVLVAQDTTFYGQDLHPPVTLSRLLEDLSDITGNVWIRFLYGHPESINDSIIKTVAKHDNICSYFDIPVQHVSSPLLKRMGRHYTCDDLRRLYDKIRLLVPDAALRTTVMVGFPGETDKDFEILLNFVKDVGFDHLGVFIYSDSEDLLSHRLSDHVPSNITSDRHNRLMASQAKISLENNRRRIGRIYDVLVEDRHNNNLFAGRTFFQAPEVDGMTFLNFDQMQIGQYASIKITDALEYDLVGQVV